MYKKIKSNAEIYFPSPIKFVILNCYITCLGINKSLYQVLGIAGHNSNLFLLMGKSSCKYYSYGIVPLPCDVKYLMYLY